jgi:hypothetical protein
MQKKPIKRVAKVGAKVCRLRGEEANQEATAENAKVAMVEAQKKIQAVESKTHT